MNVFRLLEQQQKKSIKANKRKIQYVKQISKGKLSGDGER